MIGRLTGHIVEQHADGSVLLDVQGVGYEVFVPMGAGSSAQAQAQAQELVTVYVHTHVREDAFVLYGFATSDDKRAFRALLTVSGIGPRLALAIVSTLNAQALSEAIARQDRALFKAISGVGKKTVERIFLDLKDKLTFVSASTAQRSQTAHTSDALNVSVGVSVSVSEQAIRALVQMGYKRSEAEHAMKSILEHHEHHEHHQEISVETLLRDALGVLG